MYFFEEATVAQISAVQKQIAVNAAHYLKPGGILYYITCSVFEEENEEVVQHIVDNTQLTIEKTTLINGIAQKADSMFITVLRQP